MVQGGLLTAHPGGVHGDGWSPGGGSSFRQGARAASPGSPDLERWRRRYREDNRNSKSILGVSSTGIKYRPKGAPRGATGQPGGCPARPRVGPRQGPFWSPCGGPPFLGDSEGFRDADFLYNFPEFLEHF